MNFPREAHIGVLHRRIVGVNLQDSIAIDQSEMRQLTLQVAFSTIGQYARVKGTFSQSESVIFDRTMCIICSETLVT